VARTWDGAGAHNAWIYHTGRVRFCTDNDFLNDDENRRALIGYPSDPYPFETEVSKNDAVYTRFCVRQTIQARLTGIKSSSSWSISGNVSKGDPSVGFSYTASTDSGTVTVGRNAVCDADARRIFARTSGITVTAQDESGRIPWVRLVTNITALYKVGGATFSDSFTLSEHDNS